ncbi:hypothetical protein [Fructobacillus ficulneus]|uniref:Uncharacterized protein n=1 Tax=Fructobacillus ficulneus TaxID=157463 RepID=A0A0K8MIW2_9LACO|nr:hypothetical protein [Fructobacillus ficulneus]GAP00476.1 hypothetical protein FFIC_284940 [Fructobacillus ficulneus]
MGKKTYAWLTGAAVVIIGGVGVTTVLAPKSNNHDGSSSTVVAKNKTDKSGTTDKSSKQAEDFDKLSQKDKAAVLIKATFIDSDDGDSSASELFYHTHYMFYSGKPNKMVIFDNGEGAGGVLEHSYRYTDTHDGNYQVSTADSTAEDDAHTDKDNSYWKFEKNLSKKDLYQNYLNNRDAINKIIALVDFSKAKEDFSYLPMDQDSVPANSSSNQDSSQS